MKVRGAYMTIKDFLYTYREGTVYTETAATRQDSWSLDANRSIIIPDYQREYRWEEKQLIELFGDISSGNCYLGQVAVARNLLEPLNYYLVDGQQRITSIVILLTVLCRQFFQSNDSINIKRIELHDALNNSEDARVSRLNFKANCFDDFQGFISQIYKLDAAETNEFTMESFMPPCKDSYRQQERYVNACSVFNRAIGEQLRLRQSVPQKLSYVKEIVEKILTTQISVVIFDGDSSYESEKVFLDINEKGLRLDNEDILKAYYFQSISSEKGGEALAVWTKIKESYFDLHSTLKSNRMPLETFVNYALQTELMMNCDEYEYSKFDDELRYKDDKGKRHICQLFTDTGLHTAMEQISKMLREINELLISDADASIYLKVLRGRDSSTRQVFKTLFNSICRSDMKIIYIALIKLWWLKNSKTELLTLEDVVQLFSFYIISNVSGLKKEKLLFNNNFISSIEITEAYTNLYVIELQMLKEAFTKASTLKGDQEKAEFLSFNIQMFYNEFQFNIVKEQWEIVITNQEFLSQYNSNRASYAKDHFLIQNGRTIALKDGSNFTLTRSMTFLRKRAYNFIYHKDVFGNIDFISRMEQIFKDNLDEGINTNYGLYENAYLSFIKEQVQMYFMEEGLMPSWEEAVKLYENALPAVFPRIISYILEERSPSWNQKVCNYFAVQFSQRLILLAENT